MMSADCYKELVRHIGHEIACVSYGVKRDNVAIECDTCGETLLDYDKPEKWKKGAKFNCALCNKPTPVDTAHFHQGVYIGDGCCWDDRLKASE